MPMFRRRSSVVLAVLQIFYLFLAPAVTSIKCSICDMNTLGYDCVRNSPAPQPCATNHRHCIVVSTRSHGGLDSFTRTCSSVWMPDTCRDAVERSTGRHVEVCYSTCAMDGCNESSSVHRLLNLVRRRRNGRTVKRRDVTSSRAIMSSSLDIMSSLDVM